MSTAFCTDCNHDRTTGDDVISFTPGTGWTAERAMLLAEGEPAEAGLTEVRAPDGSRWAMWHETVVGWAVVERHHDGGHEREVEPVVLAEDQNTFTLTEYRSYHLSPRVRVRITRNPIDLTAARVAA
jgi:hypothetical protein